MIFFGYAFNHGTGVFRFFNPKTKRVILSRNVKWLDDDSQEMNNTKNIEEIDSEKEKETQENDKDEDQNYIELDDDDEEGKKTNRLKMKTKI